MNSLTEEQVKQLRDHLKGHHLEAIIQLSLVTGLRRDELLSLKWQDVDLSSHELTVQNSKTQSSARMISIPEDIALLLTEHRQHQREAQGAVGLTWANLDLVFSGSCGERLCPHQLLKEFREILDLAGLPHISFHDLRSAVGQNLYNTLKQKERELDDHEND